MCRCPPPTHNKAAVETVRAVVRQQRSHWSCLAAADSDTLSAVPGLTRKRRDK